MAISFDLVDGVRFADHAGRILEEAWCPPALRYSPAYLRWQLGFPSPAPMPAAAAFDGAEPVGFAGVTARRLRCRSQQLESGIVSFVGVRPRWWKQGIAAGLYRLLLGTLRERALPVVTFGISGSGGERSLLRAYPESGFQVHPLGAYPIYTCMVRHEGRSSNWEAETAADAADLAGIVDACASDERVVWSDPSQEQISHYLLDPRPRSLILLRNRKTGAMGAAWTVRSEFLTVHGVGHVATLESVFLPRKDVEALPVLVQHASTLWTAEGGQPSVISAPSLQGFDPGALRDAGIRRTGTRFQGFLCAASLPETLAGAEGTNLEVV